MAQTAQLLTFLPPEQPTPSAGPQTPHHLKEQLLVVVRFGLLAAQTHDLHGLLAEACRAAVEIFGALSVELMIKPPADGDAAGYWTASGTYHPAPDSLSSWDALPGYRTSLFVGHRAVTSRCELIKPFGNCSRSWVKSIVPGQGDHQLGCMKVEMVRLGQQGEADQALLDLLAQIVGGTLTSGRLQARHALQVARCANLGDVALNEVRDAIRADLTALQETIAREVRYAPVPARACLGRAHRSINALVSLYCCIDAR